MTAACARSTWWLFSPESHSTVRSLSALKTMLASSIWKFRVELLAGGKSFLRGLSGRVCRSRLSGFHRKMLFAILYHMSPSGS